MAKRQGLDIKKEGSGNAGTTNALRVMGKKAGAITCIVDIPDEAFRYSILAFPSPVDISSKPITILNT